MSSAGGYSLRQKLAAEAIGSGFLLAAVVGSGIMAERLADGNVGLALLCNSLATGAALVVLITMFAPISGAHFNPVVSLVLRLDGSLSTRVFAAYGAAQLAGAVAGVLTAHMMFDEPLMQVSHKVRTGAGQWFAEGVATFGLVLMILVIARVRAEIVPVCVGLYITSAYWFTASTSFANPAVTAARTLTDTFAGIQPADAGAFAAAQVCGGLLARAVSRYLHPRPHGVAR